MSGDREISAEQQRADTDRKHGRHILDAVAAQEDRRQCHPDPLLGLLEKAHQARMSEAKKDN
jgi:hypothetical protein